jgi:hypothetical protein
MRPVTSFTLDRIEQILFCRDIPGLVQLTLKSDGYSFHTREVLDHILARSGVFPPGNFLLNATETTTAAMTRPSTASSISKQNKPSDYRLYVLYMPRPKQFLAFLLQLFGGIQSLQDLEESSENLDTPKEPTVKVVAHNSPRIRIVKR